jgi:predicted lipoprotein with Yx(FWY)xxD motif
MRSNLLIAAVFTLSLCAGAVQAQALPSGVKMADGVMTDAAGKPLYVYTMDTMKGMSHCEGRCAAAWPPLVAPAGAKATGDWSIITRDDGSKQWAYKDKPLYTFAKDTPGKPATGGDVPNWKLAK